MKIHWHASAEDILLYGISAILVIDLGGLLAAKLAMNSNKTVAKTGLVLGSIIPWKG